LLKQTAAGLSANSAYLNQAILDAEKVLVFMATCGIISVALLFFDFIFILQGAVAEAIASLFAAD